MFALTIVSIAICSACIVFPNGIMAMDGGEERAIGIANIFVLALAIVTLSLQLAYRV